MRTVCVAMTASLLLAGCRTGLYAYKGDVWFSLDVAMSQAQSSDPHAFMAALCDLCKQANEKDRKVIVQKYWSLLVEVFHKEGGFRADEVEALRAMADPDFAQRLDKEIAAIKEEQVQKQERAKAEAADKARREKEKLEADLSQLKQDTAAFLQQHSGKSIRNMTAIEVHELIGLWWDLQSRWFSLGNPTGQAWSDPSVRIDFLSVDTFYSVFGKPGRVQTGPSDTCWFLYECRDNPVRIRLNILKKTDDFSMTELLDSELPSTYVPITDNDVAHFKIFTLVYISDVGYVNAGLSLGDWLGAMRRKQISGSPQIAVLVKESNGEVSIQIKGNKTRL